MRGHELPGWHSVLAVVAHPDDESFGLGAVLAAFASRGARCDVLCLTHGEASTLHGVAGDLYRIRSRELARAARALGVSTTRLGRHADGALAEACRTVLAGEVVDAARDSGVDGLLVFDPSGVTGHPDHRAATAAALAAADALDLPVLGWTVPTDVADRLNREAGTSFTGHSADDIDYVIRVDRTRQLAAVAEHASQAVPSSVLWRRLELLGDKEYLRRIRDTLAGGQAARRDITPETDRDVTR